MIRALVKKLREGTYPDFVYPAEWDQESLVPLKALGGTPFTMSDEPIRPFCGSRLSSSGVLINKSERKYNRAKGFVAPVHLSFATVFLRRPDSQNGLKLAGLAQAL